MSRNLIEIADAILNEKYGNHPDRPLFENPGQRWQSGILYPKSYCETRKGIDPWYIQTQCVVRGDPSAVVEARAGFFQSILRTSHLPGQPDSVSEAAAYGSGAAQPQPPACGQSESWHEAIKREIVVQPVRLGDLTHVPLRCGFGFSFSKETEPVTDDRGTTIARINRSGRTITGGIDLSATQCQGEFYKLTALLSNTTAAETSFSSSREELLLESLLSAHIILGLDGGEFISLIDPPEEARSMVLDCQNIGTWPVLAPVVAGEEHGRKTMLSSPLLLHDCPQTLPENSGDVFHGPDRKGE